MIFLGEFGVVYRALLSVENGAPQAVAVKTLKGRDSTIHCHSLHDLLQ